MLDPTKIVPCPECGAAVDVPCCLNGDPARPRTSPHAARRRAAELEAEAERARALVELEAQAERARVELEAEAGRRRAELELEAERQRVELEAEAGRRRAELEAEAGAGVNSPAEGPGGGDPESFLGFSRDADGESPAARRLAIVEERIEDLSLGMGQLLRLVELLVTPASSSPAAPVTPASSSPAAPVTDTLETRVSAVTAEPSAPASIVPSFVPSAGPTSVGPSGAAVVSMMPAPPSGDILARAASADRSTIIAQPVQPRDRVAVLTPETVRKEPAALSAHLLAAAAGDPAGHVAADPFGRYTLSGAILARAAGAPATAPVSAPPAFDPRASHPSTGPQVTVATPGISAPSTHGGAPVATVARAATATIATSPAPSHVATGDAPAEPAGPALSPLAAHAQGNLNTINTAAMRLQEQALELADDDPTRAALLEAASKIRGMAGEIFAIVAA